MEHRTLVRALVTSVALAAAGVLMAGCDTDQLSLAANAKANQPIPPSAALQLGKPFTWNGIAYTVSTITDAHYKGVEGELPFEYWDKTDVRFVDLRSEGGEFATVDYSDEQPVLYLGKIADYDELHLKNVRAFEGWS